MFCCSVETWISLISKYVEKVKLYMVKPIAEMIPRRIARALNFEGILKLIELSLDFLFGVWKFFGLCMLNFPVLFLRVF